MWKPTPIERIEAQALRWQQIAFCLLTLGVVAALLLLHTHFAPLLGKPSPSVIIVLGIGFLVKTLELGWLWLQRNGISAGIAKTSTVLSIVGTFAFTWALVILTDRDDAPYFVLLSIPILQCAYRFGFVSTIVTVASSIGMMFWWSQHFFALHPPVRPTEFLEAGMISVIFCLMGLIVCYLVRQLERKQSKLYRSLMELQNTREKLAVEEKLSAVGRLASGIAHEIRNPVAMIASSLTTAFHPMASAAEREEMFAIAKHEASRLELLTTDFLTYARPPCPQRSPHPISEILEHVANMTRARGAARSIQVDCEPWVDEVVKVDSAQIQGALVNLSFNAIDATPDGGRIVFRTHVADGMLSIEIENTGRAIPESNLVRIFEPFFTSKPGGTGLGLAIAKATAEAHGGELWVSSNKDGAVAFSLRLNVLSGDEESIEVTRG